MPRPPSHALPAICEAPAKVNLGLQVLRRRPDGFHDLDTVFLPIAWADRLSAAPSSGFALTVSDPALPTDDGNLVVRAARALAEWAGIAPQGRLHLDKRVPYGGGLGGGSSDAAAALRLLADLWALDVPEDAMRRLALGLGSDVPFFLLGAPAVGRGRGERLVPILDAHGGPYRCPFWLVVAVPDVHVSTAEAFRLVTPHADGRPDLAAAVRSEDLARWRAEVTNDFEGPVLRRHPEIGAVRDALLMAGAGWAALSGTGSAVVGAFEREVHARRAVEALPACRTWTEAPAESAAPAPRDAAASRTRDGEPSG